MQRKIGKAMVVGAGTSGIRAALDLAETGYGVTLIDRSPHVGGILSQLDYQFPTDRCGMCKMLPLVDRDASSQYCLRKGLFHENIEILLSTELVSVEGEAGNFRVTLRRKPSRVDPDLCIGCGECESVCPVEAEDAFNAGLARRKAIYLPVPYAIPNSYVIDGAACTRCEECEKICPTGAIHLLEEERRRFRILVVDDELIVRDSLKEWLAQEGFAVDMAESGPQALQLLAEKSYHLMLTDIKMPGMDGVEVLQKAKADFPDLTVVMMTAYATVETAVEAMKIGALDYLVKPFDPESLVPMVTRIYEDFKTAGGRQIDVGALVLCGGASYFDPKEDKNTYGYGVLPGVLTSLEFERIFSGTGPSHGQLVRPSDGKPIRKVGWIQCVGSRNLQQEADFCSSICCMFAIKEALVAREKSDGQFDTTIFYMDMRTFGKTFQRYRDQAEDEGGVRFERCRVHSVEYDRMTNDLLIKYIDTHGALKESRQDVVVLAVGQRPAHGTSQLAEMLDIQLNPWGFCQPEPFSVTQTAHKGILLGGSFTGLKDISESVTQASAAALCASRVIHASGGGLAPESEPYHPVVEVLREPPRVLIAICTCADTLGKISDLQELARRISADPLVDDVELIEKTCTAEGWASLVELVITRKPNRLLIGACLPYLYARKLRHLGHEVNLDPALMEVVDIRSAAFEQSRENETHPGHYLFYAQLSALQMGLERLKWVDPAPTVSIPVQQCALVVGGGIAGMTAALAIADHGFTVYLVEKEEQLGGNLLWLNQTVEGYEPRMLLEETCRKVEKHPLINVHTESRVSAATGQVGQFYATIENSERSVRTVEHGVVILATGGTEATTHSYAYGTGAAVVTQKELAQKLDGGDLDPQQLESVVMIQCVDCRQEPRNYCSRVCCAATIKHAIYLKKQNPDVAVYVLYRDIMTYGFTETYYTQARSAGICFIQYDLEKKPEVQTAGDQVRVTIYEPIIEKEIEITADLCVLATGISPNFPAELAAAYGITIDQDGFFQEAESKWRPVDCLKEGIFACGLVHSARNIAESIATAQAAAQRSLRILTRKHLPTGKVVASVHHSLCSRCENCIEACPYGARLLDDENEKVLVNPAMCQGCGSCATVCPNGASVVEGFRQQQMMGIIDVALG